MFMKQFKDYCNSRKFVIDKTYFLQGVKDLDKS